MQLKAANEPSRNEKNTPKIAVPQTAKTTLSFFPVSKNSGLFGSRNVAASQGKSGLRVPSDTQGYPGKFHLFRHGDIGTLIEGLHLAVGLICDPQPDHAHDSAKKEDGRA